MSFVTAQPEVPTAAAAVHAEICQAISAQAEAAHDRSSARWVRVRRRMRPRRRPTLWRLSAS
ncbi:PE domain-containing protein [Mycobacterium alsense]|uniref:PE domain-containing protein n=1 Tax=Mycobacterium alsense TaxID=324058 RepID=A0AA42BXE1_9MYCO|nr:PE domain-containing protein [Mycobacterium alsense]